MADLIVGLGVALVIEGLLWAIFPGYALKLIEMAARTPQESLRWAGLAAMAAGVLVVWLVRG